VGEKLADVIVIGMERNQSFEGRQKVGYVPLQLPSERQGGAGLKREKLRPQPRRKHFEKVVHSDTAGERRFSVAPASLRGLPRERRGAGAA
jgi:hypothetical protein